MSRQALLSSVVLLGAAVFLAIYWPFGTKPKESMSATDGSPVTGSPHSEIHAPQTQTVATLSAPDEPVGVRVTRLLKNGAEDHQFTDLEIAAYLAANNTNAQSLLTAFEATHDREYLRMAASQFPKDPMVQTKVLFFDLFPEQRSEWIEALKQSDPDNSLPHLLAAQDKMNAGNVAGALEDIAASSTKQFNDYTLESIVSLEEAYLASGHPALEAKVLGSSGLLLPHLAPLKKLASQAADLALTYRDNSDTESQKRLLEGSWIIGNQLRNSGREGALLNDLVGLAAQNMALQRWPADDQPGFLNGVPLADQIAANKAFRSDVRASSGLVQSWLPSAPEHEIVTYFDHLRSFGELNAMNWLKGRYPQSLPPSAP